MSTQGKILLVEDDSSLAREIVSQCEEFGLPVDHFADGLVGYNKALEGDYVLVILDIKLPGKNGLDICRDLKNKKPLLPVILLTAKDKEVDRVLGFELGADDYVTKPFHMTELVARIRAKLRMISAIRSSFTMGEASDQPIQIGDLVLDPVSRVVKKKNVVVDVTAKEFDLLSFFMKNKGRVLSRRELLQTVWQIEVSGYEEAVVSMVRRLRSKIEEDAASPRYLRTARGVGYCFTEPDADYSDDAGAE